MVTLHLGKVEVKHHLVKVVLHLGVQVAVHQQQVPGLQDQRHLVYVVVQHLVGAQAQGHLQQVHGLQDRRHLVYVVVQHLDGAQAQELQQQVHGVQDQKHQVGTQVRKHQVVLRGVIIHLVNN